MRHVYLPIDQLAGSALIPFGFQALGQRHPNQACFVLCDDDCRKWGQSVGEIDTGDDGYGTAAGILGATGVDPRQALTGRFVGQTPSFASCDR